MSRHWKPNGSNAEYWRSDNPLIVAWYRLGDTPAPVYRRVGVDPSLSGILTDSGPRKIHLDVSLYTTSYDEDAITANLAPPNTKEHMLESVAGIAPWATGGSGCKIHLMEDASIARSGGGTLAASTRENRIVYADPEYTVNAPYRKDNNLTNTGSSSISHGSVDFGIHMYSGLTVIGWCQIPELAVSTYGNNRFMVGRSATLTLSDPWRIYWRQASATQYYIYAYWRQANGVNRVITLNSSTEPYFPLDRTQPFWFSFQISREHDPAGRTYDIDGSGIATLMIGTEASGVVASGSLAFNGTNVQTDYRPISVQKTLTGNRPLPLTLFCDSNGILATSTFGVPTHRQSQHMPSGSILDEVVLVNDGMMSEDRILHYALSGMQDIDTSDPERDSFIAETPGTSGLVAYWTFDGDDGSNIAPATETNPNLFMAISGLGTYQSFTDGIRGGRALSVTPGGTMNNTSDGETLWNSKYYPGIPSASGLSLLFPPSSGMTIIGWMRSVPTGTELCGGGFGWFGAAGRQNAFFADSNSSAASYSTRNMNTVSLSLYPSGHPIGHERAITYSNWNSTSAIPLAQRGLGLSNKASLSDPIYDDGDDDWHLWAGVFDLEAGLAYMVKDAKFVIPLSQHINSSSGLSTDGLGPNEGFFGFVPTYTRTVEYDDFAVYTRILTIPEMSGFAVSGAGIEYTPPPTPISGHIGAYSRGQQNFSGTIGSTVYGIAFTSGTLGGYIRGQISSSGLIGSLTTGSDSISGLIGSFVDGLQADQISGLIGSFAHGFIQPSSLFGSTTHGIVIPSGSFGGYLFAEDNIIDSFFGGFVNGLSNISGTLGGFVSASEAVSGLLGSFIRGAQSFSGIVGSYSFGALQNSDEFDISLTFQVITSQDFGSRVAVEKTASKSFDSRVSIARITSPPSCDLTLPEYGLVASGLPYTLSVAGNAVALDGKKITRTRFTFADFKDSASGTLVSGNQTSGLYQASRVFDTAGWYTVKMEALDNYGHISSSARPFLLLPSGSTSGAYLSTLPGVSISATSSSGVAIHRIGITHAISGLSTTSGVLEYTDFADQKVSLVNSLEFPSGTQFTNFIRTHDYTVPGRFTPVWAVSGSWGIVSDSISDGVDYLS